MIKFGTGGWRAEIGKDFQMTNIQLIAQALADRIDIVVNGFRAAIRMEPSASWAFRLHLVIPLVT